VQSSGPFRLTSQDAGHCTKCNTEPNDKERRVHTDADRDMTSSEGILQEGDGVLANHACSTESLCPLDEFSSIDGRLQHREREGKAKLDQGPWADLDLMLIH
jgi:hypothetical protein